MRARDSPTVCPVVLTKGVLVCVRTCMMGAKDREELMRRVPKWRHGFVLISVLLI